MRMSVNMYVVDQIGKLELYYPGRHILIDGGGVCHALLAHEAEATAVEGNRLGGYDGM